MPTSVCLIAVAVTVSSVDEHVSDLECGNNRSLGVGSDDLEGAEPHARDFAPPRRGRETAERQGTRPCVDGAWLEALWPLPDALARP